MLADGDNLRVEAERERECGQGRNGIVVEGIKHNRVIGITKQQSLLHLLL